MTLIRYIALLRGINVGGHTVKMDKMCALFQELGVLNVRSYIQTGNIFFETAETNPLALRQTIENHLAAALGYPVPTCLRTLDETETILQRDPFREIPLTHDTRHAVTLLPEPVAAPLALPYSTPDGGYELIGQTPSELFVVWHLKNGRPGSSYGQLEKLVKRQGTTRFWHTFAEIVAAARQA
jgi:Uncharacterized protein conserved in bacteria